MKALMEAVYGAAVECIPQEVPGEGARNAAHLPLLRAQALTASAIEALLSCPGACQAMPESLLAAIAGAAGRLAGEAFASVERDGAVLRRMVGLTEGFEAPAALPVSKAKADDPKKSKEEKKGCSNFWFHQGVP